MISTNPILWPCGKDNMAGYKNFVAFIAACDITAAPELPAITEVSDDADFVTAEGAFTFKEGKTPKAIIVTDKTAQYASENQGEAEGQSYRIFGEFFRAGSLKDADAFARQINNTPGYWVYEDMDGNQLLAGQPGLLCTTKPAYEGGMARTDRRGLRFTWECDSVAPKIYLETASKIDFDALFNPAPVIP